MAKTKQIITPNQKKKSLKLTKKGELFPHKEFGINFPDVLRPYVIKNGEHFLFVTINNGKYLNELHPDGVVHEPATDKDLVKESGKTETHKGRHILVRFISKGDLEYEYIGDEEYMIRYDQKRNKIFVK